MQGHQTWTDTAHRAINRNPMTTLIVLVLFFLIGVGIGYFVSAAGVKQATLNVQIDNDTGATQDVRVFLNDDQVAVVSIVDGGSATVPLKVGWTSTANGMFEVRATPVTTGASDSDTRTVSNGQTVLIELRVR